MSLHFAVGLLSLSVGALCLVATGWCLARGEHRLLVIDAAAALVNLFFAVLNLSRVAA